MMQDQMTGMASGMPQDTGKAFRVSNIFYVKD